MCREICLARSSDSLGIFPTFQISTYDKFGQTLHNQVIRFHFPLASYDICLAFLQIFPNSLLQPCQASINCLLKIHSAAVRQWSQNQYLIFQVFDIVVLYFQVPNFCSSYYFCKVNSSQRSSLKQPFDYARVSSSSGMACLCFTMPAS